MKITNIKKITNADVEYEIVTFEGMEYGEHVRLTGGKWSYFYAGMEHIIGKNTVMSYEAKYQEFLKSAREENNG